MQGNGFVAVMHGLFFAANGIAIRDAASSEFDAIRVKNLGIDAGNRHTDLVIFPFHRNKIAHSDNFLPILPDTAEGYDTLGIIVI